MEYAASSFCHVEACKQLSWELTWELRWQIAWTMALASKSRTSVADARGRIAQSRASVADVRSKIAQSRAQLRDSYQLLRKVSSASMDGRGWQRIDHENGHAELNENMGALAAQPTPEGGEVTRRMMALAAQPTPEYAQLIESMMALAAQPTAEYAELNESFLALAAQLTPEDRAKCARFMDLLISARGDELAQRVLRRVTDLEELIAILKRRVGVGRH